APERQPPPRRRSRPAAKQPVARSSSSRARRASGQRARGALRTARANRRPRPPPGGQPVTMSIAVHQVLASLGYGDAIGHEVLGIQRVLRAAGYESEIFVESADARVRDRTFYYREL